MKVIILAGGKGNRMLPLTKTVPKPLIKIHKKSLIMYTIDQFKKYHLSDFILTLNYKSKQIISYFGRGDKFGIKVSYFIEDSTNPLGTAGAIAFLKKDLKDTFIVVSGDTVRKANINKILSFHKSEKALATIVTYLNTSTNPKSIIHFDTNNKIIEFIERPKNIPKEPVWSNASLYIFEPEILKYIKRGIESDFGKDIFPKVIKRGGNMYVFKNTGYFLDVGTREKIKKLEDDISTRKVTFE